MDNAKQTQIFSANTFLKNVLLLLFVVVVVVALTHTHPEREGEWGGGGDRNISWITVVSRLAVLVVLVVSL